MAATPGSADVVIESLARGASWKDEFFGYLERADQRYLLSLAEFVPRLSDQGVAMSPAEADPLVERLIATGNVGAANRLWRILRNEPLAPVVIDGGFEQFPPNQELSRVRSPFGWQLDAAAEIYAVEDTGRAGSTVLSLAATGDPLEPIVWQQMALTPGTWTISYRVNTRPNEAARLRVAIYCARPRRLRLNEAAIGRSTTGWQQQFLSFKVPPNCPSQLLEIATVGMARGAALNTLVDDFAVSDRP
jgi:hypothetical protein